MTNLKLQKKLAAKVSGSGKSKVKLNPKLLEEIKGAITRADIKEKLESAVIKIKEKVGVSRHRARKRRLQRKKGRRKGPGKKTGSKHARLSAKRKWINSVRVQRRTLKMLKQRGEISSTDYRALYKKVKGGFFRSKRHLLTYAQQQGMIKK